jgi:hypothetical protein
MDHLAVLEAGAIVEHAVTTRCSPLAATEPGLAAPVGRLSARTHRLSLPSLDATLAS